MIAALSPFALLSYWAGFFAPKGAVANSSTTPIKSDDKAKASRAPDDSALQESIRRCRLFGSKPVAVQFCISEAKRWHEYRKKNPEPPPKPKTPLERELAHCEMASKPAVVQMCKREAPAKVARRQKEAEERAKAEAADKRTPLQKARDRCRMQSGKTIQQFQCMQEANKKYSNK